jgi:iron complex outermembrane recepter protein
MSARYNDTHVVLRDQLGTALNGDHTFARFNGAAGFVYRVTTDLRLYANYGESNRAPSPVELTCADANDPCALPNAFLTDPALQQVIAHTVEVGAHGTFRDVRWHAGLFRTGNSNDILFISAGALTNRGFFDNVGDTRRQGIELGLSGNALDERLHWFANYTWLQAEFRESFYVMSPHNPAEVDGQIPVRKGSRIPGTPEHLLTAGASMTLGPGLTIGVDVKHQSDQYFRGDEGNLTTPLRDYTAFSASAEWKLNSNFTFFAEVENLFDSDYATFGLYGSAEGVLGDGYDDPRFVSPAAPRSAWVGIRWTL